METNKIAEAFKTLKLGEVYAPNTNCAIYRVPSGWIWSDKGGTVFIPEPDDIIITGTPDKWAGSKYKKDFHFIDDSGNEAVINDCGKFESGDYYYMTNVGRFHEKEIDKLQDF